MKNACLILIFCNQTNFQSAFKIETPSEHVLFNKMNFITSNCTSCYKLLNITPGIGWHPQNRILYCYKSRPLSTGSGQNVWFFCWEDVTECGRKFTKNGTWLCRYYTGYLFFALYNIKSSIVKLAIHCKHKSKTMNLILMINITKEC